MPKHSMICAVCTTTTTAGPLQTGEQGTLLLGPDMENLNELSPRSRSSQNRKQRFAAAPGPTTQFISAAASTCGSLESFRISHALNTSAGEGMCAWRVSEGIILMMMLLLASKLVEVTRRPGWSNDARCSSARGLSQPRALPPAPPMVVG